MTGAAYLFERSSDGAWLPKKQFLQNDAMPGDDFGYSASMNANIIIVGAPFSKRGSVTTGSASVFERQGAEGEWVEQTRLTPEKNWAYGLFGAAVATDGNRVVVGGFDMGPRKEGLVQVYSKREGTWIMEAVLSASDRAQYAQFGVSVAIDGDTLLVGAVADEAQGVGAGAAYVFVYENGQWVEQAKLLASQGDEFDFFGHSIDLHEDTAVVGAYLDEQWEGAEMTGSAYVFSRNGSTWREQARLLPSDMGLGGAFGISVALNAETVMVGAYQDGDKGTNAGAVYVFRAEGNVWRETVKLHLKEAMAGDEFGYSVDISETGFFAVGAPRADTPETNSGAIGLTWTLPVVH
jgi:hypothetical protein